jgi:hypothetical protein
LRRRGDLRERGIFYDLDALTEAEIATIQALITQERAQALGERIYLMTRSEFVENVFLGKATGLGALIVGFNLPFDLSRLAIAHGFARGFMKGEFRFTLRNRTWNYFGGTGKLIPRTGKYDEQDSVFSQQ